MRRTNELPRLSMGAEHPILFSAEMIRAIVDGRKTVTRRMVRPTRGFEPSTIEINPATGSPEAIWKASGCLSSVSCPYGGPGDQLVPFCTWAVARDDDGVKPTDLPHDVSLWSWWESAEKPNWCGKSRPGRFMPKFLRGWLPRLPVIGVRVERLQDINGRGVMAEGIYLRRKLRPRWSEQQLDEKLPPLFAKLWDSINKKRGYAWATNPWVWVVTFKRTEDS